MQPSLSEAPIKYFHDDKSTFYPSINIYGEAADLEQTDLWPTREFHGPGSFTPLLLLMRRIGGEGDTVKKMMLVVVCND